MLNMEKYTEQYPQCWDWEMTINIDHNVKHDDIFSTPNSSSLNFFLLPYLCL